MTAWNATATVAVALPMSFLLALTPRVRGGEDSSPLLLLRSLREEPLLVVEVLDGAWGPMGITPVKIRFEAARASSVRPSVRHR